MIKKIIAAIRKMIKRHWDNKTEDEKFPYLFSGL